MADVVERTAAGCSSPDCGGRHPDPGGLPAAAPCGGRQDLRQLRRGERPHADLQSCGAVRFPVCGIGYRRPPASGWRLRSRGGGRPCPYGHGCRWNGPERGSAGVPARSCSSSMDADGTKAGFDLEMTRAVTQAVSIPVIASGGCGSLEHFAPGLCGDRAVTRPWPPLCSTLGS